MTDDMPYPSIASLYPDTALLSKDPKDRVRRESNDAAGDEDGEPDADDAQ